ncbi:hypothetical protein VKT23_014665 [Stygiomarasmius scandens]|uniref:SUN domain-containing protein n=1 Tax=Marasmiellus scandens TaxID=2682957 RepID=A0ABR1IZW6_9AGAR
MIPRHDCVFNCNAEFYHSLWSTSPGPDFALGTAGGNVLIEMTSPTYGLASSSYPSAASGWAAYYQEGGYEDVVPPLVVIDDQVRIGQCWSLEGEQGHIAIRLAAPINVTHVAFHYPNYEELRAQESRAAPQNVAIWALVEEEILEEQQKTTQLITRPGDYFMQPKRRFDRKLVRAKKFVQITSIFFNPQKGTRQLSETEADARKLTTALVVTEVISNWGAPRTCLYRIAVHGKEM